MTNFEKITASPEALGEFLASLPVATGPWDEEFHRVNGVQDIGADTMITKCSGVSTDFSKVEVGEAVWCKGHIGIYIGGGLAVECTPKWKNCVQVTACNCTKSGYNRRNWTKHGKH